MLGVRLGVLFFPPLYITTSTTNLIPPSSPCSLPSSPVFNLELGVFDFVRAFFGQRCFFTCLAFGVAFLPRGKLLVKVKVKSNRRDGLVMV